MEQIPIDLAHYPLDDLFGASTQDVIRSCRADLSATGACELTGFVTPAGVEALRADAQRLAGSAHRSGGDGSAYLEAPDLASPAGHPRRWLGRYATATVAYDLIPPSSPLRRIYECDALSRFVEQVLDRGPIYPYADPFGALNLAVMHDGDELQWHFDQTDFVVSLAIQSAVSGGDFEVAPRIRRADDPCYDRVAEVLGGNRDGVVTIPMKPGTLLIFEGRHSLHRVTPVIGGTSRLVGLLAFDTKPGTMSTTRLRLDRYGRAEPGGK